MAALLLAACAPPATQVPPTTQPPTAAPVVVEAPTPDPLQPTALPTRERWPFGTLLPYVVQSGDTLAAVAAHFNTTADAIIAANPDVAFSASTLAPGLALTIPASFAALLGSPFQIIPDSELVYGPAQVGYDLQAAIDARGGWLAQYQETNDGALRPAWEILHRIGLQYSINPRLMAALLEYRSGVVTGFPQNDSEVTGLLGIADGGGASLGGQLRQVARILSDGYYGWRAGTLVEVSLADGRVSRIDPWQNAGTVALHHLFASWYGADEFDAATGPEGFAATYKALFGDPFESARPLMGADLAQPALQLPFEPDKVWAYSGGPHPAWDASLPWAALDFAPPAVVTGCGFSMEWVTAMADGVVARSEDAAVVLDLDRDGDERTGWAILYYHLRTDALPPVGAVVRAGDPLGHPSCDGGRATGSHVHVARKYNGEWLAADGFIPFDLSGWVAQAGVEPYDGRLVFDFPAQQLTACPCVRADNHIALP